MDGDTDRDVSTGRGNHLPNGKFAPANRANTHGNPNAQKMFRLRREILESAAASPEAIRAAFSRLFRRAIGKNEDKDGSSIDLEAMKLYLYYTIGRPTVALELSGPDGEPLGAEWARVEAAIVAALEPFGDRARFAVAAAIRGIVTDADGAAEQPGAAP
jgi:hypothetical protein